MKLFSMFPGEAGIHQTIYMMRDLANRGQVHPWIRERAANLVKSCNRAKLCEAVALTNWVKAKVSYLRDPMDIEALHDPVTFYEKGIRSGHHVYGDCDDMSTYLAALLKSIGHQPYFRVLARSGSQLHHVHIFSDGMHLDPTMMESVTEPLQASRAILFKV